MSRVVVFAYSEVGFRCLKTLLEERADIAWVVTHRDDAGETRWYRSVADLAAQAGIRCAFDEKLQSHECLTTLQGLAPDFIFSFYFRRMLRADILKSAARGALNMHGSLLPHYRGRAPINWAIVHGESQTGATLHYMVDKPDAGDVVDQEAVAIGINDTAFDVSIRVAAAAAVVMRRSWPQLDANNAPRRPQDLSLGSYFPGRTPADGVIDFSRPAWDIHNLIRAVAPPFPGAFGNLGGIRIDFLGSRWCDEADTAPMLAPRLYPSDDNMYLDCVDGRRLHITRARIGAEPLTAATLGARFGELRVSNDALGAEVFA
jgi:methionyl-tRNA formyltransferase